MNLRRLALASLAVFIFVFVYEWLFHGQFLMADYTATKALWRSDAEMIGNIHWLALGQTVMAVVFCVIFTKGYEGRGGAEGARYGALIGLLVLANVLVRYAVEPIPVALAAKWFVGGMIEMIGAGVIAALVYRRA